MGGLIIATAGFSDRAAPHRAQSTDLLPHMRVVCCRKYLPATAKSKRPVLRQIPSWLSAAW